MDGPKVIGIDGAFGVGRYRKIETRIWNDGKFRALSERAKLTFLCLLSHPQMTSMGAMRGTIHGVAADIGTVSDTVSEAFQELSLSGLVEHDERGCLIVLRNYLKYNEPENENVVKSWLPMFDELPECDLKVVLWQRVMEVLERKYCDSKTDLIELWNGIGNGMAKGMATPRTQNPEPLTLKKRVSSADADGPSPELLSWVAWWNDLKREGLVAAGVSGEPISEDVKRGWKRVTESKEVRQLLSDREVLVKEIKASAFLRAGWFTLGKLLGGKNRDGAYIAQRIVDGGYRDMTAPAGEPPTCRIPSDEELAAWKP